MKIMLSSSEIFYLAMLNGSDEIFGIEDIYFGKTDDEIRELVKSTSKTCMKKKLCTTDFEDKVRVSDEHKKVIDMISFPDRFTEIILRNTRSRQSRRLFYAKGKEQIVLLEDEGVYSLCETVDELKTGLQVLFSEGCMVKAETGKFTITHDEMSAVHSGKKPKSGTVRALLRDKGIDRVTVQLAAEGMAGKAGYLSVTSIIGNHCESISYLADSGIALQIKITPKRDFSFEKVKCSAAKQTVAAFIGGDFYV